MLLIIPTCWQCVGLTGKPALPDKWGREQVKCTSIWGNHGFWSWWGIKAIRLSWTLCRNFLWWLRWRTKKTMVSFVNFSADFLVTWANHLMPHTSLSSLVRWGRNNTEQSHTGTKIHIKVRLLKWSDTGTNTGFFIATARSSWREMKKGRAFKFCVTGFSCPQPLLPGTILYSLHYPPPMRE